MTRLRGAALLGTVALLATPVPARSEAPPIVGEVICVVDELTGSPLQPACPKAPADAAAAAQPTPGSAGSRARVVDPELVPNLIVAKFVRGADEREVRALVTRLKLTTARTIPALRLRAMQVKPERREEAMAELARSPLVERVEQDRFARLVAFDEGWGPRRVGVSSAWNVTRGSQNVTVAVIDTGVDASHPELRGSFVPGYDLIGNDADPNDEQGHGTAVAGIIAARSKNGRDQAGLCPACSLMAVRVLGADGYGTTSTIADGMVRAVNAGARVLNLSLGSTGTTDTEAEAVTYALDRGVVVVAAAGNDGRNDVLYPAAFPGVIGVAATDERDRLYPWSNRGGAVRVAAPGCNTAPALRSGYAYFCGTSAATPMVAGIAALALSLSPQITSAQVLQALERTAFPIAGARFGRVDAARTIAAFAKRTRLTASGRLEAARARTYRLVAGPGSVDAAISVPSSQRVTLTLLDASGSKIATVSTRRSARIRRVLPAGTYTLRLAAPTSVRYVLRADYITLSA
jgi:subtilisin family serine protease